MDKSFILNELKKQYKFSSNAEFAAFLGITPQNLSNWYSRNTIDYELIYTKCEGINGDWLLSGLGPVRRGYAITDGVSASLNEGTAPYGNTFIYPLVSSHAVAGFGSADFTISEADIQALYKVPDFNNVDFMIRVKGNSMYPKYSGGDIIACRILRDSKFIEWNKPHLVSTSEHGLLVKRLKKCIDDNCITAVSDNKEYDPFDIPKSEIKGIAIIVGVIRLE